MLHAVNHYYHFGLNMKFVLLLIMGASLVTAMFSVGAVITLSIICSRLKETRVQEKENEKPVVRYQSVIRSGDTDILDYRY